MEYLIFGVNLLWPLVMQFFFHKTITTGEMFITVGLVLVLGLSSWMIGNHLDKLDVQIISGEVTGKKTVKVSCSHTYDCYCYDSCSGSGSSRSCTRVCQTCYEHSHHFHWDVYTSIGEFEIDRIDRQGEDEPPRWTQVKMNDPVARRVSFVNYIKVAPDSLFNNLKNVDALPYVAQIPEYPVGIYDYYRIDRAIQVGINIPDLKAYSVEIENSLRTLGAAKQVNYVMVFVPGNYTQAFAETLKVKWLGGKKNDVIVVAAFDKYPASPKWVQVVSWTDNNLYKVVLRDRLAAHPVWTPRSVVQIMNEETKAGFKRKSWEDFKDLENEYRPSAMVVWVTFVLMLLCNIGLTWFFHKNETV